MTISFPITLPTTGGFAEPMRWMMVDAVGVGESPYTFSQEVFEHAGKRWAFEARMVSMQREDAEEWIAALASLRGRRGTFYFSDPLGATGRGALSGTPLVKGGSQTGGTILIDGCGNGVTNWVRKGDWLQVGTELQKSLVDANSNGSGEVTLELWPGLRSAPADNAVVTVSGAKGIFRLTSNERGYDIGVGGEYQVAFAGMEAL
jgi:hypothetical protein